MPNSPPFPEPSIFAIYSNKLYWFVEKEINFPNNKNQNSYNSDNYNDKNYNYAGINQANFNYGSHKTLQNYIYSMNKCEIVLENSLFTNVDFSMLMDINVNNDSFPEFIIFSEKNSSLFWIKKYIGYISGFGWDSNFWIYLMIYIYIVSSILGVYRFLILKNLKEESENNKFVKKNYELNLVFIFFYFLSIIIIKFEFNYLFLYFLLNIGC